MKRKNGNKVLSEQETQEKYAALATQLGCLKEFRTILHRYENLLKKCTNEIERKQISIMGNVELHNLFGFRGGLTVDGEVIIPAAAEDEGLLKGM